MLKRIGLIMLALFFTTGLALAQEKKKEKKEEPKKVVIIKKTVDKDGNEVIEKTVREGKAAEEMELHEIHEDHEGHGEHKTIHVDVNDEDGEQNIKIIIKGDGDVKVIELLGDGDMSDEIKDAMGNEMIFIKKHKHGDENFFTIKEAESKAFLGVMLNHTVDVEVEVEDGKEVVTETIEEGSDKGVMISDVVEESPAAAAGLKKGDIITNINGQEVKSFEDLTAALSELKIGDKVQVKYLRGESSASTEATLADSKKFQKDTPAIWHQDDGEDFFFEMEGEGDNEEIEIIIKEENGKKKIIKKKKKSKKDE